MTLKNRIAIGKLWKERLTKGLKVHDITLDHPYIKEYEDSIKVKEVVKEPVKKRGK